MNRDKFYPIIFVPILLIGSVISVLASALVLVGFGHSFEEVQNNSASIIEAGSANLIKTVLLVNHLIMFIAPAIIFTIIYYKKEWLKKLHLDLSPKAVYFLLGFILLMVSMPLVGYSYEINQMIPLPEFAQSMEDSTAETMKKIMAMEGIPDLLFNLFLVAIIPAIGEELVFRGVFQGGLSRIIKNKHVAVWISAFIFSFFHMQFEGFFPRVILGAVLGYGFLWTKSLWVPMFMHFANNAAPILGLYFLDNDLGALEPEAAQKVDWYFALLSGVGIIGMFFVFNYFSPREETDEA